MDTQPHFPNHHLEVVSAELEIRTASSLLNESLNFLKPKKKALVLGDPFAATSKKLLVSEKFVRITAVDPNPSLLDESFVLLDDERLDRVIKKIHTYDFRLSHFDFIYSETIADAPAHSIQYVLPKILQSLSSKGTFFSVWNGKGDSFHTMHYTDIQLLALFKGNGFKVECFDLPRRAVKGSKKEYGTRHEIVMIASKK